MSRRDVAIRILLSREELDKLDLAACSHGVSRARMVRRLIHRLDPSTIVEYTPEPEPAFDAES